MSKAYRNQSNAGTTIFYTLTEPAEVTIRIYDILGRGIVFLEFGIQHAGDQRVIWTAKDRPSGIYFYKITSDRYSGLGKMALIK